MARHTLTEEELARGRRIGAPLGGKAVATKTPPDQCPRCGKPMTGRSWHAYLGHRGLHGLADRYFAGDVEAAQRRLRRNGQARPLAPPARAGEDPAPWNDAMPTYKPVTET